MTDIRKHINIVEDDLRSTNTNFINIDDAIRHFDMPVDISRSEMKRAFSATKKEFLAMFKGQTKITIYRGLIVSDNWQPANGLGQSWAFAVEGALKGSGLNSFRNIPNREDRHPHGLGVMLVGEVSIYDIDWLTTIAVNAFHEDEREIVVNEGASIFVQSVFSADATGVYEDVPLLKPNASFEA